jgi:hypothetical protein
MEDQKIEFLPFHAINDFMRPDFRLIVIKDALSKLPGLPSSLREPVERNIRKSVKIPGFRHPEKAPLLMKITPCAQVFEKNPEFVADLLAAWAEAHPSLRSQVMQVFQQRGWYFFPTQITSAAEFSLPTTEKDWGILPATADRTRLPGFVIYWPKSENFEALYDTYIDIYPGGESSMDEVGLMAVWLSMRLPYHHTGSADEADESAPGN